MPEVTVKISEDKSESPLIVTKCPKCHEAVERYGHKYRCVNPECPIIFLSKDKVIKEQGTITFRG